MPPRTPGPPPVSPCSRWMRRARSIGWRTENAGPMTRSGTNSYVVRAGDQVWVVDPGPRDPEHLAELLLRCGADSRPRGVLVTHRHLDHTAGAATLARQLAARSGLE